MDFQYNADNQRNKTLYYENNTLKKTMYYVGSYEKEVIAGGSTKEYDYIYTPEGLTAIAIKTNGTRSLYYVNTDHLGSVRLVTTASKAIQTRYYYDAWGRQTLVSGTSITNRGYTGHEHLNEFGLINMNARLYDPVLGRFLEMDPYVQMPDYTQGFNRYAYCLNNPLVYVDASGEFWFIPAIVGFVVGYISHGLTTNNWGWKAVGAGAIGAVSSMLGYGAGMGAAGLLSNASFLSSGVTGIISAGIGGSASGATSALLTGGNVGKGALIGFGSGLVGGAISNLNIDNVWAQGGINIGAGGLSGGAISAATGGNFWEGAKYGAISSAVGWGVNRGVDYIKNYAARQEALSKVKKYLGLEDNKTSRWAKAEQKEIPNMTTEKWEGVANIFNEVNAKYDTNFRISQNFDIGAKTYKFDNLHLRYSKSGWKGPTYKENKYKYNYSYHYDGSNIMTNPAVHIIFDTLYQGFGFWNW